MSEAGETGTIVLSVEIIKKQEGYTVWKNGHV